MDTLTQSQEYSFLGSVLPTPPIVSKAQGRLECGLDRGAGLSADKSKQELCCNQTLT